MKLIFEKWFKNESRVISIINYKKGWKSYGNPPLYCIRTNGAKKSAGDKCLDVSIHIGYLTIMYTNFDLQNTWNNLKRGK